jgi:hypothetical protein
MMGGGGVHVPARKNITEKRKNKQQRQATVDQPSPTPTTHTKNLTNSTCLTIPIPNHEWIFQCTRLRPTFAILEC